MIATTRPAKPSSVVSSDPNTLKRSARMPPGPVTCTTSPGLNEPAACRNVSATRTTGDVPSARTTCHLVESRANETSSALPSCEGTGTSRVLVR